MKSSVALVAPFVAALSLLLGPGAAEAETQTVEHTVRAGDNLHLIAGYYYRDPRQWRQVWKRNRTALRNRNLIVPGQVLRLEVVPGRGWDLPYEDYRSRVAGK